MKKYSKALLLCCAIFSFSLLQAQSSKSNQVGRITISAGIGLVPTYYRAGETTGTVPVMVKIGVNLNKFFSINAFGGFSTVTTGEQNYSADFGSYLTNKTTVLGLRAEVKKEISRKLDIYSGAMLGYHHSDVKEFYAQSKTRAVRSPEDATPFDPNATRGKLAYSAFLGSSYHFSKKLGAFFEVGYGISLINTGLTIRL